MSLLLSGGGNYDDVIPLDEFFVSQIDLQKPVLYIPIAMEKSVYTYEQCLDWFKNTYKHYGIRNIEMCIDLKSIHNMSKYTAVFIGGGNTFILLNAIKESNFDEKLIDYYNQGGFIYGGSAGAIIFGKTIKLASYNDENNIGLENLSGLNLVGGKDIWCHYTDTDNNNIKNYENDLFILYEESGLYVQGEHIQSVGKMFLRKNDILYS